MHEKRRSSEDMAFTPFAGLKAFLQVYPSAYVWILDNPSEGIAELVVTYGACYAVAVVVDHKEYMYLNNQKNNTKPFKYSCLFFVAQERKICITP